MWWADIRQPGQFGLRPDLIAGSAWAFPVIAGVDVVAVIEFLDPRPRKPDERLLQLAPAFGTQLGRAVEWDRVRQREAGDRKRLEELLAQRTREAEQVERSYAVADQARDAFVAYLSHDARRRAALLISSVSDGGESSSTAVEELDALLDRLVRVVDRSDRRFAGERLAIPLAELAAAISFSQSAFEPSAIDVRVNGQDEAVIELNVELMTNLIALVLAHISATSNSDAVVVDLEVSPDNLAATISSSAAFALWDTEARVTGDDEISQAARLAKALGGFLTVSQSERQDHVVRVVVATQYKQQGAVKDLNRRILLVDDNEINRKIAGAMLSRLGLEADVVTGGLPALTAMTEREYGLILMDVQMPDLDGRDATRRWRSGDGGATRVDVPIVAVTAHVAESERVECLSAGMNDYLSKPFGLEGLQATVRRWISDSEDGTASE